MEKLESYEWDYVFKDIKPKNKNHVYMTNLSVNILVHNSNIEDYLKKGYQIGYCKPYIHCRENSNE